MPASSPASPVTVSAATTITGTYKAQYQVTFAQSGIGVDTTGTVVTINGTLTKTAAQLPFSDFYDGTVTYAYCSQVSAGTSTQYLLTTPASSPGRPATD